MKILNNIDWKVILKTLYQGGLVIFPSDTVYGALVDAKNRKAVEKLINFKNRPPGKPISVFVSNLAMADQYVFINENQQETLEQLIPGPFTFVFFSKHRLDKRLESEKGTLGIRIPQFEPVIELVKKYGYPLTATSANLGGQSACYSIEALLKQLPEKKKKLIDLIIDYGKLPRNKPSTVVDLSGEKLRFFRLGDLQFLNSQTFISNSPKQTKKIAQFLINKFKYFKSNQSLIFILQGELGVGKTTFVKGAAESLGIDNIVSPTFVIYYEYKSVEKPNIKPIKKLIHIDLYNIQEVEELKDLRLDKLLKPDNLVMIEWGEKIKAVYDQIKEKGKIVYINMEYLEEKKRKILVSYD